MKLHLYHSYLIKLQSLFMVLILLLVLGRDIITYTAFKINQDFIAAVLCINKDKPQMHCNGNCHLNKELKKNNSEDRESQANFPVVKHEQKIDFFANRLISDSQTFGQNKNQIFDIDIFHPYLMITDIFHPPRIASACV